MLEAPGIAKFAELLPDAGGRQFVTLGEGDTLLIRLKRLGQDIGVPNLYAKLEGFNPTGSYKDRIAAMSMTLALAAGKQGWIATSSGNGSTSLGAYGARAGLPGLLLMVPSAPREKLVPSRTFGPQVVLVDGIGTDGTPDSSKKLYSAVRDAAQAHDLFVGVTAHSFNPDGMRGADTIAYELCEGGSSPEHCYVPTGGGGLVSAVGRGFIESGADTKVVATQPSGCAPIARVLKGELERPTVDNVATVVSGLQLPVPPDGELAINTIQRTGGWGTHIEDEAVFKAQSDLAVREGIFVEPACATALAAAAADRREGRLPEDAEVVLVLTSTGLKDLSAAERRLAPLRRCVPEEVREVAETWANEVGI